MNELSAMAKKLAPEVKYSKTTLKLVEALNLHRFVFLTGKAGSGKSHQIRALSSYYKSCVVTATTGIAAINIKGETIHSFLCLDIIDNLADLKKSDFKNRFSERFRLMQQTLYELELLIIDEVSMLNKEQLRMVLYRLRDFPNIKLLLVGDFPQLKPVSGRPLYISNCFTQAFQCIKLRKNHRQKNDEPFQKVLDEVRNAIPSKKTLAFLEDLENNSIVGTVKLRSKNSAVKEINETELAELESPLISSYRSITYRNNKVDKIVLDGILHNLREPESFLYKVGARVMVTRNVKEYAVFNGDLATVLDGSGDEILILKLDRGDRIIRMKKTKSSVYLTLGGKKEKALEYYAFSAMIAYAITIHKSQGLTLDKIDIDCQGMFDRQMFYVALSRATSSKGVQLHNTEYLTFRRNTKLLSKWYVK